MKIGSLFAGIGGLELGLERSGLGKTVWQVEIDSFCRSILRKHWPEVKQYEDIKTVGAGHLAPVDLICGGFPCQDISSAGKGAGLSGSRSGLWREFRRVVAELSPEWVVIENVASGATRWVDTVCSELEELQYDCLPIPLSAADVGAPHLRKRIFVVAHSYGVYLRKQSRRLCGPNGEKEALSSIAGEARRIASNSDRDRKSTIAEHEQMGRLQSMASDASPWAAAPEFRGMADGVSLRLDRLRALGNAVVPQCAEVIGHVVKMLGGDR